MGAKTAQPKSGKKHKRTKRKPDAPAQKRARTESQIGAVLLFFLGIAVMVLLSERVGFRTTAEETGHGRATIGSCEHKADGAHCRATLNPTK